MKLRYRLITGSGTVAVIALHSIARSFRLTGGACLTRNDFNVSVAGTETGESHEDCRRLE